MINVLVKVLSSLTIKNANGNSSQIFGHWSGGYLLDLNYHWNLTIPNNLAGIVHVCGTPKALVVAWTLMRLANSPGQSIIRWEFLTILLSKAVSALEANSFQFITTWWTMMSMMKMWSSADPKIVWARHRNRQLPRSRKPISN